MKLILPLLLILCVPLMADEKKERFENAKALAGKGDRVVQYILGWMYERGGEGVEKDSKEAVKWYRKAAEQGNAGGQWSVGNAYYFGEGVLEDNVTAYAWYNISAANGSTNGEKWKNKVADKMTPEDISKAQALSKEMLKKNPKLLK